MILGLIIGFGVGFATAIGMVWLGIHYGRQT